MAYRLNKQECLAIEWYKRKHDLKVTLSILPIVYFKDKKGGSALAHIKMIVELYELGKVE